MLKNSLKQPAQPFSHSLRSFACGAESVPRNSRLQPERTACQQRLAVLLALQNGQAVEVRLDPAHQQLYGEERQERPRLRLYMRC